MFDLAALRAATAAHGRVARVVIAGHDGSSPRETGAAMLVWADGQSGTIGGGALEWEAVGRAKAHLAETAPRLDRMALGPSLGQCCGGAVTVLTEVFDASTAAALDGPVIARRVSGAGDMPLAVRRILNRARAEGVAPLPRLIQGWMVEPVAAPSRLLWLWGAGHVGRAIVDVIAPLPDIAITWIDTAPERFPATVPPGVTARWAANPADLVAEAPTTAEHLVLTYSHALDLELCHRLLGHGFGRLGLIGSETKWARFRSRLRALGHPAERIGAIRCPIGDRTLGKHPQAIAIGVAAEMIRKQSATASQRDSAT